MTFIAFFFYLHKNRTYNVVRLRDGFFCRFWFSVSFSCFITFVDLLLFYLYNRIPIDVHHAFFFFCSLWIQCVFNFTAKHNNKIISLSSQFRVCLLQYIYKLNSLNSHSLCFFSLPFCCFVGFSSRSFNFVLHEQIR